MAATGNDAGSLATATGATEAQHDARPVPSQASATGTTHRASKAQRRKRVSFFGVARRVWVLLVIIVVVAIAAFAVYRLHGVFGKSETTRPGMGINSDP